MKHLEEELGKSAGVAFAVALLAPIALFVLFYLTTIRMFFRRNFGGGHTRLYVLLGGLACLLIYGIAWFHLKKAAAEGQGIPFEKPQFFGLAGYAVAFIVVFFRHALPNWKMFWTGTFSSIHINFGGDSTLYRLFPEVSARKMRLLLEPSAVLIVGAVTCVVFPPIGVYILFAAPWLFLLELRLYIFQRQQVQQILNGQIEAEDTAATVKTVRDRNSGAAQSFHVEVAPSPRVADLGTVEDMAQRLDPELQNLIARSTSKHEGKPL